MWAALIPVAAQLLGDMQKQKAEREKQVYDSKKDAIDDLKNGEVTVMQKLIESYRAALGA